jgi:DNA modification methylase
MIINADSLHIPLASKSVQCVVTSPPYYYLRDYGVDGQFGLESSPEEYIHNMVLVFREVYRVLRDDGTLWLNIGDTYASGGRGGNYDYISGAGKDESIIDRSKRHSTRYGGGNAPSTGGIKPKDLIGIPWMLAFSLRTNGAASVETMLVVEKIRSALLEDYDTWESVPDKTRSVIERLDREWEDAHKGSWYLRSEIIWNKLNPMPESAKDRPTKSHEQIFLLSKSPRYYYDSAAIEEPAKYSNEERYARAKKGQKSNPGEHNNGIRVRKPAGWDTRQGAHGAFHRDGRAQDVEYTTTHSLVRNKRDVWSIATQPCELAHFATFPEKLVEPCILAGTKQGDIVFDPFSGSGTVERVAISLGRRSIGCELKFDYINSVARVRTTKIQRVLPCATEAE